MTSNKIHTLLDRSLDFLIIAVSTISVSSLILLVFDIFDPKIAIFSGIAFALIFTSRLQSNSHSLVQSAKVGLIPIGIILLIALIFRAEPYPWINGGQDQGVYISMSAHYQNGGKIFIEDSILPKIDDPHLIEDYKKERLQGFFYHPGVFYSGQQNYVFQFYHLHPLWMAIFGDVFGDEKRTYALTFFSLIGIVFLILLAYELSSSRFAAISVGVLLAVNPLHVFFSKWPTTEIVALAFTSMSFYYLARSYRFATQRLPHRAALFLSAATLAMFFFTRISGFLYLPSLLLLFMGGVWLRKTKQFKFGSDLVIYAFICIFLYVLSVFYGLIYSFPYSESIYKMIFGSVAGISWQWALSSLFIFMLTIMIGWVVLIRSPNFRKYISPWLSVRYLTSIITLFILLAFALSLFKVYQIGYTDAFADDPWLGKRWKLSGSGIGSVYRATVINWFIYVSPLLVILGGAALFRKRIGWPMVFLLVVPAVALSFLAISSPVITYQYYYARYLLTEAVPYSLVIALVAIFSGISLRWKIVGAAAVLFSIIWFSFFSIKQFGAEEGIRPYRVLDQVAKYIDTEDVLLLETSGWKIPSRFAIETPLRFYFGLNTFALPARDHDMHLNNMHLNKISSSFRRVWLLSPVPIIDERFMLHSRLLHQDLVMERTGHVPLKLIDGFNKQELYLYVLKSSGWPGENIFKFGNTQYGIGLKKQEIKALLGKGWYSIEREHVWSSEQAELVLRAGQFKNDALPRAITLQTSAFGASLARVVVLEVDVCGVLQTHKYSEERKLDIKVHLPTQRDSSEECRIKLMIDDATSPQAQGRSQDSRILGIALYGVTFE